MALKYTGFGDAYSATVTVYGDGTATSITLDLTLSPFDINFSKGGPSGAFLASQANDPGASISFDPSGSMLTITFDFPPPAVSYDHPTPGGRQLLIRFLYG